MPQAGIDTTFRDPQMLRRFGNLTALATSEVLVYGRTYTEPASEAQRSVVSTSTSDSYPSGTGARTVRLWFLNNNYELKYEDINLNGTTAVDTVATDIRFIEALDVIAVGSGGLTVGAVKLMTATGGGGTEIAAISASATQAQFAHHYVPVGKQAWVYQWGATVSDEAKMKLLGQEWTNGNLVSRNWDLEDLMGISQPPGRITFERTLIAVPVGEKTYVRITALPNQATSTVIRAWLYIWEQNK